MAVHRKLDIVAIVAVVLCVLAYASFRTEFRLIEQMPAEFFDPSQIHKDQVPRDNQASEEKIARAYWKCAVTQIQWKYGYAHRLPEEPPAEFAVNVEDAGPATHDAVLRAHYWTRLRIIWNESEIWQEKYTWSPISLKESLQSAGQWLELHMRRIVGNP
jgi:hypothetical protein